MSNESEKNTSANFFKELEESFTVKELRLSKSVRKHIRGLKEAGQWEQAFAIRRQAIERKSEKVLVGKANDELNETLTELLTTKSPKKEAELEIKAIWLLYALGDIETAEERNRELLSSLDAKPEGVQNYLEERLAVIRDQASHYITVLRSRD